MRPFKYSEAIDAQKPGDGYYFLVDFNGTLAHHEKGAKVIDGDGEPILGAPIKRMVERVKRLIASGMEVRIQCGTVGEGGKNGEKMSAAIREWCKKHLDQECAVTGTITPKCLGVWNDKARGVIRNTGRFVDE